MGIPHRYAPLSAEQRFWVRALPGLLAPSQPTAIVRALHQALVVPSVLFVSGSAEYQIYLAEIFHRTWVARIAHFVGVPLGIVTFIGTIARGSPLIGLALGALLSPRFAGGPAPIHRALPLGHPTRTTRIALVKASLHGGGTMSAPG